MCRRPQAGRCSPPHRAAAGCRSSAAAENAYFLTESGCESVGNIPTFREFPARKSLPSFVTKRRRQKCPQDTAVRSVPASGAMRKMLCASRNDDYSVASVPGRPSTRPIALLPLLFAVLDLLVLLDQAKSTRKTEKGENFPIDSSGRIPRFRRCIRRPFSFPDFSQGGAMGALRSHCLRYFSYL